MEYLYKYINNIVNCFHLSFLNLHVHVRTMYMNYNFGINEFFVNVYIILQNFRTGCYGHYRLKLNLVEIS